MKIFHRDIKP